MGIVIFGVDYNLFGFEGIKGGTNDDIFFN